MVNEEINAGCTRTMVDLPVVVVDAVVDGAFIIWKETMGSEHPLRGAKTTNKQAQANKQTKDGKLRKVNQQEIEAAATIGRQ